MTAIARALLTLILCVAVPASAQVIYNARKIITMDRSVL